MKIGDIFRAREAYSTPDEILAREVKAASLSYPAAPSDAHALAFSASTLRKNLAERTIERDRYHDGLTVRGAAWLLWRALWRDVRGFVKA